MASSALVSSHSGSSLSQSSAHQKPQFTPTAVGMSRARSKTDPTSPNFPMNRHSAPSPRRSTTAPSAVTSPAPYGRKPYVQYSGTTPPLVPDSSPLLGPRIDEDPDLHLLTPPPTPPCTSNVFSFNGNGTIRQDGYYPSPYKMPPNVSPYATTRRGHGHGGVSLGPIRRPANTPGEDHHSSRSSERNLNRGDDCDDERSSSCSSRSGSFPGSDDFYAHHPENENVPLSPTADISAAVASDMRPQFNARKASAQCRAMQGYISFANVEGLGMPPDDSFDNPADGDRRRRGEHERGRSMFSWGVGGFRKLLGVGHVEGGDREHPQQHVDGVAV